MDLTERAEIRKETFYKLTNSREVPSYPANGHRNLAQTNSSSWSNAYTNFNGGANSCASIGKVLTDGLQVGDTVKIRIVLKYTNVVPASGKTAKFWPQGSGNVTQWNSGSFFNTGGARNLNGSGEIVVEATDTVHPDHLKNAYWDCNIRFDYVASGSVQWKEFKVEIGKSFTPYSQAPEQMGWSKTAPVPTPDQRYLWKFEYIYYSDGTVEVTPPVNLSIAGGTVSHRETFYKLTNSATPPDRPTGTRNLLLYTNTPFAHVNDKYYSPYGASATTERVNNSAVYKTGPNDWNRLGINLGRHLVERGLVKAGDKVTYSVLAKTDQDKPIKITLYVRYKGSGAAQEVDGKPHDYTLTKEWKKIEIPFTITEKMVSESTRVGDFSFEQTSKNETGKFVYYGCNKIELGDTATPYNQAPEDYGWSKDPMVPTQSNRYLWKFEYIYYSDGNFEVTEPVNISIAGEDGKNSYIHTAYANITKLCNENQNFTVKASTVVRYGYGDKWVYKTFEAGTYAGSSTTFGKDPYSGKVKQCDAITDFSLTDSTGRNWLGTYSDNSVNAVAHPSFFTWQLTKGQNGATGPQGPKGEQGIAGATGPQGTRGPKGEDGKSTYIHIKYSPVERPNDSQISDTPNTYIGVYTDNIENDSNKASAYTWSKWQGRDGAQGVPGKPGADGKTTYVHFAYANSADGKTNFNTNYFAGALYVGTLTDHTATDSTNYAAYTWSRLKGEDGVIESNGENRIFYGRGDTKKGFFKNATIGTDWNGVPYGEFDNPGWHTVATSQKYDAVTTTDGLQLLGKSTTIPTGKWTMTQDIYLTDSIEGCGGYNFVRAERLPGAGGFHDITYIDNPIITNKCRRAIWNPEPDRVAYGGNPLINPLEVNNHQNSPVKITTKCVPDELGNGVTQYTIESTSSNPTCSLNIPSVRNAIPQDANKTWTATLKIRANKTCTFTHLGFERFSVMQNVTVKPEWQTLYFNGKATGQYGTFILYGLGSQYLSSKLVIEIAEVKICDENVSKEVMSKTLLTRHWYRMSETHEFVEADRVGLSGAITGGVQLSVPAGKKTDAKIRLRNVSLRHGDAEIPFAPAPEDIYDQNNSKVDQDQLDQIANELRDQQDRLTQELAAKALASEVSELTTQIKNLKESDLAGKADITKAVGALEKRLANVIPLGNMSQKLQFIDSYILQGEEGMEIGNKNSGSKVMITPDRIGFFSGGTEVASFSSGQLRINNGFFADTITVGHFMTRKHPNNQYVNGTYFVK